MNKKFFLILVLVAILAAALPMAALAGKQQTFEVSVRNRTGAAAEVRVTSANGKVSMMRVPAGYSTISLAQGVYSYWVSSACGNSAGSWNLNVDKILWIDCGVFGNAAWVAGRGHGTPTGCSDTGWYINWEPLLGHDHWAFFTETYWDDRVVGYAAEIADYQNSGFEMMQGCLGDYYYDEYYIGYVP